VFTPERRAVVRGGNECVWAYESWGKRARGRSPWKERLGNKSWGPAGTTSTFCLGWLSELDPTRPYWAKLAVVRPLNTSQPTEPITGIGTRGMCEIENIETLVAAVLR